MKNIFGTNNDQSSLNLNEITANKITVNSDLCLSGLNSGSIIINSNDGNDCVNELLIGPARYVLEVDQSTNIPAWTNNIKVDRIESNIIKYAGTQQGDLLQANDNGGSIELDRIPIGTSGQILTVNSLSNGAEWNDLNLSNLGTNGGLFNLDGFVTLLRSYSATAPDFTGSALGYGPNIYNVNPGVTYEVMLTYEYNKLPGSDFKCEFQDGLPSPTTYSTHSSSDTDGYFVSVCQRYFRTGVTQINPIALFDQFTSGLYTDMELRNIRFSIKPLL